MAYLALNGTNPRANVQNNMKRLWVKYTPATPVSVPLGQEFDLSLLFPGDPKLTALFKTRSQGTSDVMSRIPLSLLCCMYGLEGNKAAFIEATSNLGPITITLTGSGAVATVPTTGVEKGTLVGATDAAPNTTTVVTISGAGVFPGAVAPLSGEISTPETELTQQITAIYFAVDMFPNGRLFTNGDLMELIVTDMPSLSNIEVYISDFPYMSANDKPFKFRTQTVLSNNDFAIDFSGKIIFPNDPTKIDTVQLAGNNFCQWDLNDFYCNADSDFVTTKTTYNTSPFIYLDTKNLKNVKFKALAEFNFYYKTTF